VLGLKVVKSCSFLGALPIHLSRHTLDTMHSVIDGQLGTDDIMKPIADHTACSSTIG